MVMRGKGGAEASVWKLLSDASVNNEAFLDNGVQILWEVKTPFLGKPSASPHTHEMTNELKFLDVLLMSQLKPAICEIHMGTGS